MGQGFASGDLEKDAFAIRYFMNEGHDVMASVSYAKNFGLYGERVGSFSVCCSSQKQRDAVLSQLDIIIRNMYSNPPFRVCVLSRQSCRILLSRPCGMRI